MCEGPRGGRAGHVREPCRWGSQCKWGQRVESEARTAGRLRAPAASLPGWGMTRVRQQGRSICLGRDKDLSGQTV